MSSAKRMRELQSEINQLKKENNTLREQIDGMKKRTKMKLQDLIKMTKSYQKKGLKK